MFCRDLHDTIPHGPPISEKRHACARLTDAGPLATHCLKLEKTVWPSKCLHVERHGNGKHNGSLVGWDSDVKGEKERPRES